MPNNNRKKIQLYRNEEIYTPSAQQGLSALEVAKNDLASFSLSDGEVIIGRYQETNQNVKTVIGVAHDMSNNNEGMTFFTDSSDFVSRPVVLYQTDGTTGLLGVNEDGLGNDWQLENYDFTPYKYLRCYFKMGNFSTTNTNLTPSMVIELPLEAASKSKSAPSGDGQACDMYVAGGVAPNPSDPTTVLSVLVAVDSTKTKFQVVYQNMYDGWQYNDNYSNSPTEANNNGRFLYKIEGCFDALNNASEIEYLEHDPIFTASAAYNITNSDVNRWRQMASEGRITEIVMNNETKGTSGIVDLGTVVTTETDPTVPNWAKSATKPSYTASEVGAVPTTRTVNGKALTGNITLTAEEVGALPDTTVIPTKVSDLTNDSGFTTNTGTITGITMNGVSKGTSGIVNLGTVVTTETDPTVPSWAKASTKPSYTASEVGAVPTTRTVNGKELSSDISLTSTDVGAVPRSRTVNEKPLSGNITLTAEDVGALPDSTVIPSKVSDLTNDSGFTTNTGTITGITMNGVSKGTNGVVNLGTVLTSHQDISGKADKSATVSDVTFNVNNGYLNKTIDGTTTTVVAISTAGRTGSYNDLTDKPNIPHAQVQSDWNATSGMGVILNKPSLSTVATSGSYNDLSDKPTIPSLNNYYTKSETDNLVNIPIIDIASTGSVSQTLAPNTFYRFSTVSALTLTLTAGTGLSIYSGKFTASADNITITFPSTIKFPKDTVSIVSGCTYEFNIADGICILKDITVEN